MIQVELKGYHEIEIMLKTLPDKLQKKTITYGLNKVAQMFVKEAKQRCPENAERRIIKNNLYKAGNLKRSIAWGIGKKYRGRYVATRLVGIKKKGHWHSAFYGRFVELGHRSRNGKTDVKPHPFLEPAFFGNTQKAINLFRVELLNGLEKLGVKRNA